MCIGQVFAGPFPSSSQMSKKRLQAMESMLQRTPNIASQRADSYRLKADVEFLYPLNNFSKATQDLDSKLCEHLYSALITNETTPLSIDISVRTLANVAKMLIDLQIIRDEIEHSELTEEKEELQKSVVHFAKGSLAKPDDEDDLLTSFA